MPSIQMAPAAAAGIGGLVMGDWGTYQPASDGTYTVDVRDAVTLLRQGFNYMAQNFDIYTVPKAPAAATVSAIVASGAISNGSVAVTANPDVMRQVTFETGTGTGAITGGTATIVYQANDGAVQTDILSLVTPASSSVTQYLTKGVVTITSITVAGLAGGTSPWLRMSSTASISLPVSQGSVDIAVRREYDDSATVAVGTLSTVTLATIAPTTAPNATHTYSFDYVFVSPIQ